MSLYEWQWHIIGVLPLLIKLPVCRSPDSPWGIKCENKHITQVLSRSVHKMEAITCFDGKSETVL